MSLVTASDRDTAQTEGLRTNVVFGLTTKTRPTLRSLLERSVTQGDNPVRECSTVGVNTRVAGVGYPL